MKKLLFPFIFLPFLFFSQSTARYPSLLWKISGNGLKKPSYLYGTMHVSNRVAYYLSEQFFDALRSVDVVGLETNPGEWLENMERTGELSELSQIRTAGYNGDFYKSAFTVAFPERRMLQGILSYDPDIINGLLYRQNKTRENFEESTYIDLFIFQSASKLNKKLISLEDFGESEIMARLAALPDEEPGSNPNSNNYNNSQKIEDAYRDGNLDVLDSLSKLSSSRNMQKYLIDARNVFFVETMDSVMKRQSLFAGVGAAHLPGTAGVIELLKAKGYSVQPVSPTVSKKSNAIREELDQKVKPVKFVRQYAADSLYSVNVPGKLYPIVNLGYLGYDIHADMVNGSFYTVVRLKHHAPLFNLTSEQMMARIDSLLFENIPGKILVKKNITAPAGIKAIEIVNRMRRGDEQHYQIYFTDLEMIMFKLGGKGQYASSAESKQFFGSITFNPRNGSRQKFSPAAGGFSVIIPGSYSYNKNTGVSVAGLVEDLYAYDKTTQQSFGIKRAIFNDFVYLEEDTFELNQLAKNVLSNYDYKIKPAYSLDPDQSFPCIRFTGQNALGHSMFGKIHIKGVHYYLQYQVFRSQPTFDTEFFNSFRLTDFRSINPLKEITDKEMLFKAVDEVTDDALSRFNEAYIKAYEKTRKAIPDTAKSDAGFRSGSKFYYSPSSNEYVSITFEKYSDYDYRDPAKISERIEESFRQSTTMFVGSRKISDAGGVKKLFYVLKDTATRRAIDVRIFFNHGVMQEISAPFDTVAGMQGWLKGFMDSFTPLDSAVGMNVFENKFSTLLADLSSADTAKKVAADNALKVTVSLQKPYLDELITFFKSPSIHKVSEDSRAQLFVNAGTLESDRIIAPFRDLYTQYTDSFYLQLCLLKGLALLQTTESYNAFNAMLLKEPPLVGDENSITDVFAVLHDSLELCRNFFPGMLALTRYDEYRDPVYSLLADLVNNKFITPQKYVAQKEAILLDANLALKRYSPVPRSGTQATNLDHLDKSSRELAENIIGNLDGLTNNNLYRNSDYLRSLDVGNRPPLVNYACVLNPFYHSDPKVKEFITKLSRIKSQDISMPLTINLLKNKISVNDTMVNYYSRNKYTRAFFYSELEKEKLQDMFRKEYLSQQSLIESVLSSQKQLSSIYNAEKDRGKKDSLTPIKVVPVSNKYQKGNLYIFKHVRAKNEDEQWSAVFVPENGSEITSRIEILASGYYINKNQSELENVNDLVERFALSYRKRALANNGAYE